MIILNNAELKLVLEELRLNPDDNTAKEKFLELISKVIKCTTDRYPISFREDLSQELMMFICKKLPYLVAQYTKGEIRDLTSYLFRLCLNASINLFEKEKTYGIRFVSLEDIKADKEIMPTSYLRYKVIERIREEVTDWIRARLDNPRDHGRAIRYIDIILEGKRPSFKNENIKRFHSSHQVTAKEAYSMVLSEIRKRLIKYRSELLSK